jgi:hypothetical protein
MGNTMLERVLKQYPRFFDKSDNSNNLKFIKGMATQLKDLETSVYLIKLARNLSRPLKIYRAQIMPHTYDMHFIAELDNIKRVKIYKDNDPDELLFDSGELAEGLDSYQYTYHGTDPENVIPTQKFFMAVEDHNENKFVKGFPQNETDLGDEYDQDDVLDRLGNILGVGRRIYKDGIIEDEYPTTYPPYCISKYEWDYYYEQRLIEFVDEYESKQLPVLELKKFFGVEPQVQGRWRNICFMDVTDQDDKFMATEEWDYPVYDVTANLDMIPANIDIPSEETILKVLEKAFPLSKKVYWQLLTYLDAPHDGVWLTEEVRKSLIMGNARPLMADMLGYDIDSSTGEHGVIFADYVNMVQRGSFNHLILADDVQFIESYQADIYTTDYDWNGRNSGSSWMAFAGTGNSSYLKNALTSYAEEQAPDGARSYDTGGNSWTNPNNARYADGSDAYSTYYAGNTDKLQLWNYGFNIPSDAVITGIVAKIRKWFYGSNSGLSVYLEPDVNGNWYNYGKGTNWGTSWNVSTLGGSSDKWGRNWTPAEINAGNFGVGIHGWSMQSGYSGHVDYCYLTAYWQRGFNATWTSQAINPDPNMYGWDNIVVDYWNEPGYTAAYTEVLNANTGDVLIAKTASKTIDISSIDKATPIKVKVYLDSNTPGYYAQYKSFQVNGRRYVE